jgi:steroid 5-alpha reductase family enzyme
VFFDRQDTERSKKVNKLKQSRTASFIIITLVYILATAVGVAVYRAVGLVWWLSLLIADASATVITFIFSLIFKNASVYDPYWSVQPPIILFAFALGKNLTSLGFMLLFVVFFWAIRLTANWAYTFSDLTHQDWRYTMLNEKCGAFYPIINFIGIHMVPTLIVYLCTLPAVYAIREGLSITVGSIIFLCISLLAALMQGIADIEMHKFRKAPNSTFIRNGLWKYSRHPNYLGEIMMWWGVGLSVVFAEPGAWYLLAGALANTALFLTVSIPMADTRQSRKDGFAEYKKETRMLLPIKK